MSSVLQSRRQGRAGITRRGVLDWLVADLRGEADRAESETRVLERSPSFDELVKRQPPQPVQRQFLDSPADIAIFGGAAGGGKTWALVAEAQRHVHVPRFAAVIFRRIFPSIEMPGGLWDEARDQYTGVASPNMQDHEWTFPSSGARVKFAHLQHSEKTHLDHKGGQYPLIGFDQLEEFEEQQFWYMTSRNRSTCGVRPYIRGTCNPVPEDDPVGGWLCRMIAWWIDRKTGLAIPERAGMLRWFVRADEEIRWASSPEELRERYPDLEPLSFTFIPARLEDNEALTSKDPSYRARLAALPYVDRERLLGGNWKVRATAGTVFDRAWFDIVDAAPAKGRRIRYWDKAGTKAKPGVKRQRGARSAGVLMMEGRDGYYYILDMVEGHWSSRERNAVIGQTASSDGRGVHIWVEQEPGSGGKESAEHTIIQLAGYTVRADRVTGGKVARAGPLSAQAEARNIKLVRGPWNESLLAQFHRFDENASMIDGADAAVGAFNKIATRKRKRTGAWFPGMDAKASEEGADNDDEGGAQAGDRAEDGTRSGGRRGAGSPRV